jgi:hypothetical protein
MSVGAGGGSEHCETPPPTPSGNVHHVHHLHPRIHPRDPCGF